VRGLGLLVCALSLAPWAFSLSAQDQAPNRREFTIVARDFHYSPDRIEVMQDDLVKVTIRSEDIAHSFTIDEYRIVKRVAAGGSTTFEFRADRAGTFPFYCNLTSEPGHAQERGQLVVRSK
jgi:heme/copper-type cytochrome/quinol oxidase subunit 2